MPTTKKWKISTRRGFTLMETIGAVVILVVLMGLAIPAVAALQKNLYMTRMDDYARQIFLAAQNEMTGMKDSGRLDSFSTRVKEDGLHQLTAEEKPSDFPDVDESAYEDSSAPWMDLYVVSSRDAAAEEFLLRAGDSLRKFTENGGEFLLELNPVSGDVYSAFYAESPFAYREVLALSDRGRATRGKASPKLGYYGSGTADTSTIGTLPTFSPNVTVVNGEELYLSVTCKNMMALRRTQRYLTLTVTISDGLAEHTLVLRGGSDFFVVNDGISVTKVLDSLEEKNAFSAVCPELTPGRDLTVTADLVYYDAHNNVRIEGSGTAGGVNSLFGGIEGDGTILVSRVRHLNNLRESVYTPAAEGCAVRQTADISFDLLDWDADAYCSAWTRNPLARFAAIENDALFTNGSYTGGTGERGNELRGFVFSAGKHGGAGLFDSLTRTTLTNIRITDCVSAGQKAASLAGALTECTVTNCGVYLNTKYPNGGYYPDMEERREQYRITGTVNAGGLVSSAEKTAFENCYAAIDVSAQNGAAGGLAAILTNCTVTGSYASGDVTCPGYGGGFVGYLTGGSAVQDCYATGDVVYTEYGGGFAGSVSASDVRSSRSYGQAKTPSGGENTATGGGFAGSGSGAVFSDCEYLWQSRYNNSYLAPAGVTPLPYDSLRSENAAQEQYSEPYSLNLRMRSFPFPLLKRGEAAMIHYGDWPEAYQLQASLVYYEKYRNDDGSESYGYYAQTTLTSGGVSIGNHWILDTLRNEICIEDGYALLSVDPLNSFDYVLTTGVKNTSDQKGTVGIANVPGRATEKEAAQIAQNINLTFSDSKGSITISNANVYRLPFALQINDRLAADTFWEKLVITGYADDVGGAKKTVIDKQTFYYCPDFAKNAVNPQGGVTVAPAEPSGEDSPVYVRSARQFNGLSRSSYYWNTFYGTQKYFLQETDIDFSTYTKQYCGKEYNLMDTSRSNPYRNLPIGRQNIDKNGQRWQTNNFQNVYDGNYKRIIDYCCEVNDYRFAGIFGEVQNCVIKNINLVASDPVNHSGYVRSGMTTGSSDQPPGVGALVGLLYVDIDYKQGDPVATVENCTVTGYEVSFRSVYEQSPVNLDYAIGGIAGFTFGTIKNSSVVDCGLYSEGNWSKEARMGGLTGSLNGTGSLENSYAACTFHTNSRYSRVGGLTGGLLNIWGYGDRQHFSSNAAARYQTIQNCYSFATLKKGGDYIDYSRTTWIFGLAVPSGLKGGELTYTLNMKNCYYLTDTVENGILDTTSGTDNAAANGTPQNYAQLSALSLGGRADAAHSYPWSVSLLGKAYPFPALVKGEGGRYVHYGNWPS